MSETQPETDRMSTDFTVKTWMTDVTFLLEGRPLYASKSVLAIFSPVFNAMFGSQFREQSQKEIELPGKDYESFHEFLKCLYPNVQNPVRKENAYKVLPLAHEYQCENLLTECIFRMKLVLNKNKNVKMIVEILALAIAYNIVDLTNACIDHVSNFGSNSVTYNELKELGNTPEFKDAVICIQNEILRRQMEKAEDFQTEIAHICQRADMNPNFIEAGEDFTSARGDQIKMALIDISDISKNLVYSRPTYLWAYKVYLVARLEKSRNQILESIRVSVVFLHSDENNAGNWSSDVKVKLVLKSRVNGSNHRSFVNTETIRYPDEAVICCDETASALWRARILIGDSINMVAYILANEPVHVRE